MTPELPVPPFPVRPGQRRRPDRRLPREPITSTRIVDAALEIMARDGFEAVTMRSIAHRLGTGPASLYAHLDGKRELYALMVDRVADEISVPDPDPDRWQEQLVEVGRELRNAMRRFPGIARVIIGYVPVGPQAMRSTDRMLAILLAGGIVPQVAAWACDLFPLYVTAVAFEESVRGGDPNEAAVDKDGLIGELRSYFTELPQESFPNVTTHALALTTGGPDERFEFGLRVMIAGVEAVSASWAGSVPAAGGNAVDSGPPAT